MRRPALGSSMMPSPSLTFVGPGGVGKTRLALAVTEDIADHFLDGMVWIDLAPLADPALVAMTVATVGLGITPIPGAPPVEEMAQRSLRSRQQLLVLDNCERVLAETATLDFARAHSPAQPCRCWPRVVPRCA